LEFPKNIYAVPSFSFSSTPYPFSLPYLDIKLAAQANTCEGIYVHSHDYERVVAQVCGRDKLLRAYLLTKLLLKSSLVSLSISYSLAVSHNCVWIQMDLVPRNERYALPLHHGPRVFL